MRLLVTGRTGQVARALLERGPLANVDVITVGRPEFDLTDAEAGLETIRAADPDVIVSAAAYTAVDKAESEPKLAETVNAEAPGVLARCAAELGIPLIHLSTDYVFDGRKAGAYVETDATNPQSVYGATKLRGETAVSGATPNHVILRTAWVTSPWGQNFIKTMLRLARKANTIRVVRDQVGNPTSALDLADGIIAVAGNLLLHPARTDLRGTFHAVGSGNASWADFAEEIFRLSDELGGPTADVVRITTADYPTAARRPATSCLNTGKLFRVHGVVLPGWQSSLRVTLERLHRTGELAGGER